MPDRRPGAGFPIDPHGFHEEEPVEAPRAKDAPVRCRDIASIATSLRQIAEILDGGALSELAAGVAVEASGFWLDDDYLYLEVALKPDGPLMDICVHRGRAFFRVERET